MSGIAAVVTRDGRPADEAVLSTMLDAMRTRGGDGSATWSDGSAALGFLAFHTTPESQREPQPWVDRRSGRVIAFDGRIDNRDDLVEALGGAVSAHDGDAAFAAAAFDRWGADSPRHLLGDFAFALWDPRGRRLVCARDVMGVRPLCYALAFDGTLLVASEMRALLATGLVDETINEARVLEFLSERRYHSSDTLYSSIQRLKPAHTLIAGSGTLRSVRYWDFDPGRTVRYRRDEEYVEHARHLLRQSVRAQTRGAARVGILLSGGVDSSSVAALAAADGVDCTGFSVVFPGQPCDETPFIEAVSNHCAIPVVRVVHDPREAAWYDASVREYRDLPDYPNGVMLDPLRERASRAGIRVLLTGTGGDEWFAGSRFHYADWLRRGAVARIASQLASDTVFRGPRRAASDLLMLGGWPLLPPSVRHGIKRIVASRAKTIVPEWIPADAAARAELESRIAFKVSPREGETFAQADVRMTVSIGIQAHNEEMDDRSTSRTAVEQRHPLYDRRIMEFAYGLPEEQLWRDRYRKHVLRAAVPELPPMVRWRRDKAEFSHVITAAVHGVKRPEVPRLVDRGWIVPGAFDETYQRFVQGTASGDPQSWSLAMPLWMMFGVECWLEQTTTRSRNDRRTETAAAFA